MTYTQSVTTVGALVSARTDTATTQSSTTVLNANAVASDIGHYVTGPGIPAGTSITGQSTGTSWTLSQAATASTVGVLLTVGQKLVAVANRTGFVRVYDATLGGSVASSSENLPLVNVVTKHQQFDDAAPWYAQGGGKTDGTGPGTIDSGTAQTGLVDVTLIVAASDTVNAASVQTFHTDSAALAVVATG
jgi:hypothetical protein